MNFSESRSSFHEFVAVIIMITITQNLTIYFVISCGYISIRDATRKALIKANNAKTDIRFFPFFTFS